MTWLTCLYMWNVPRKIKIIPKTAQNINYWKYELCCEDESDDKTSARNVKSSLFNSHADKEKTWVNDDCTCTVNVNGLVEKLSNKYTYRLVVTLCESIAK